MKQYNKQYFNRNRTTDVIAFSYAETYPFTKIQKNESVFIWNNVIGSVLINYEIIKSHIKKYNIPFVEEFCRLIIHGILHVFGYDDIKEADKKEMFRIQEKIIHQMFRPNSKSKY